MGAICFKWQVKSCLCCQLWHCSATEQNTRQNCFIWDLQMKLKTRGGIQWLFQRGGRTLWIWQMVKQLKLVVFFVVVWGEVFFLGGEAGWQTAMGDKQIWKGKRATCVPCTKANYTWGVPTGGWYEHGHHPDTGKMKASTSHSSMGNRLKQEQAGAFICRLAYFFLYLYFKSPIFSTVDRYLF